MLSDAGLIYGRVLHLSCISGWHRPLQNPRQKVRNTKSSLCANAVFSRRRHSQKKKLRLFILLVPDVFTRPASTCGTSKEMTPRSPPSRRLRLFGVNTAPMRCPTVLIDHFHRAALSSLWARACQMLQRQENKKKKNEGKMTEVELKLNHSFWPARSDID